MYFYQVRVVLRAETTEIFNLRAKLCVNQNDFISVHFPNVSANSTNIYLVNGVNNYIYLKLEGRDDSIRVIVCITPLPPPPFGLWSGTEMLGFFYGILRKIWAETGARTRSCHIQFCTNVGAHHIMPPFIGRPKPNKSLSTNFEPPL